MVAGFDLLQYEVQVVRPLRRLHGPLPPNDLLHRYAVTVDMDAAEIEERLATVRSFWHRIAKGPDRRALVGSRLLAADRDLNAAGVFRSAPADWPAAAARIASTTGAPGRPLLPTPEPVPLPEPPPVRQATPAARSPGRIDERPGRSDAAPVLREWSPLGSWDVDLAGLTAIDAEDGVNLRFETISTWEDGGTIAISWTPPNPGEVRIRRFTGEVPWESGEMLPLDAVGRRGEEVRGKGGAASPGRVAIEADVPVGYFVYVPLVVVGASATVGRSVGYTVAEPVRDLRAQRGGDRVVLSWVWPGEARQADVLVHDADGVEHRWQITRAQYDDAHGFPIPVSVAGGTAEVNAVTAGPGTKSPAVRIPIPPVPPRIGYTIRAVGVPYRRRWVVTLDPFDPCDGVDVCVVALTRVMPAHSGHGVTIANRIGLTLQPGLPFTFEFRLPKELSDERSLWVRCFAERAGMIDPPASTLRIR